MRTASLPHKAPKGRTIKVPAFARTHALSKIPGGKEVTVLTMYGDTFIYNNVKFELEYITAIMLNNDHLDTIHLDGVLYYKAPLN